MEFIYLALLTICLETLIDFYQIRKTGHDSRKSSWIIRGAGYLLIAVTSGKWLMAAVLLAGFYTFLFDSSIALVLDKPFNFIGSTKVWDRLLKKINPKLLLTLRIIVLFISIALFYTLEVL